MIQFKLFMLLLGCRPKGRFTEQHDVFFGIGKELNDLIPDIKKSWPEASGNIHIDAWREITCVDGFSITVEEAGFMQQIDRLKKEKDLFFINLGGYRENEFDEFHYKILMVANDLDEAKKRSKTNAFYKHQSLPASPTTRSATAHIDDKYGIDVDDAYAIQDILPVHLKQKFSIRISLNEECRQDDFHLGYFRLNDL